MSKYRLHFFGVIILALIAGYITYSIPLTRGIDIDGGIRVVLQVDPQRKEDWPADPAKRQSKLATTKETVFERIKGFQGVAEPRVVIEQPDKIVATIPGVKDPEAALELIKSTASLEFYHLKNVRTADNPLGQWRWDKLDEKIDGQEVYEFTGPKGEVINSIENPKELLEQVVQIDKNKPILTGKDILPNSKVGVDPGTNMPLIELEFNKEGTKIFREFTRSNVGEVLAIFFDGKLLTAPRINEPIPTGKAQISGGFANTDDADRIARLLNAGALPVPLKVIARDSVEPTLGKETLNKVLVAGMYGLGLVILFMIIYYKLPGILATIALMLYALFTIAFFKLFGATLSLAGFAALIISIGMAVDANILIFERLKEELLAGKTLRSAIDTGFNRAFTAILDSNVCTWITCAILMYYGTATVQSFGFTLFVGVAISMFTAITVTRTMLHMLVGWQPAQNPAFYGLKLNWLGNVKWDIVGKKVLFFIISAIIIIPGLFVLATSGLRPGIEFKSGTTLHADFKKSVTVSEVRDIVHTVDPGGEVQLTSSKKTAFINSTLLSEQKDFTEKLNEMLSSLDSKIGISTKDASGRPAFSSVASVGPSISSELKNKAIISVIIASILIIIYLSIRFAISGVMDGVKYGVCAVIALIHDSAFILGMYSIFGKTAGWEVDSLFVTAVLTIIGFSVHDTIVVFDRVRENLKHRERGESFTSIVNKSIIQTLSRSINTSLTVMLTLGALIVFGGPLLKHFYWAMMAGVIVGTYSSICIACPLLVVWNNISTRRKNGESKKIEDKPVVETPLVSQAELQDHEAQTDGTEAPRARTVQPGQPPRPRKRRKR
ncbi:MAG: protein translocase subunit SecD [Armatimonadota bacterium]